MILQIEPQLISMLTPLFKFDRWLFEKINEVWISPFFDQIFPILLREEIWYPLYLFLLIFALYNFGLKGWWWLATLMMTVIISDLCCSFAVKSLIHRLRPCQNPDMVDQIRLLLNYCPAHFSFPASPASNHFAAAWFIFITLNQTGSWRWLLFPWAILIGYTQIYVGVHYPIDIAAGSILGTAIGLMMSRFFKMQFGTLAIK